MVPNLKLVLALAFGLTLASLLLWQVTGGDFYTKFEVVEQVPQQIDPDDPLAAAGFYEGDTPMLTVTRDDFRFGLLPTPSGVLDLHLLSVVSVSLTVWSLAVLAFWWTRRQSTRA